MSIKIVAVGALAIIALAAMFLIVLPVYDSMHNNAAASNDTQSNPQATTQDSPPPGALTDKDVLNDGLWLAGGVLAVIVILAGFKALR